MVLRANQCCSALLQTRISKDATQVIAEADQGGLGLPDRDYYLKDEADKAKLRQQYLAHVQKMLALVGETWMLPRTTHATSWSSRPH